MVAGSTAAFGATPPPRSVDVKDRCSATIRIASPGDNQADEACFTFLDGAKLQKRQITRDKRL